MQCKLLYLIPGNNYWYKIRTRTGRTRFSVTLDHNEDSGHPRPREHGHLPCPPGVYCSLCELRAFPNTPQGYLFTSQRPERGFWKMAQLLEVGDAQRTRRGVVSGRIGCRPFVFLS